MFEKPAENANFFFFPYFRDLKNRVMYGFDAPKYCERIWVHPLCCSKLLMQDLVQSVTGLSRHQNSGLVVDGTWPFEQAVQILECGRVICVDENDPFTFRIKCCVEHWIEKTPWEKTGIYEHIEKCIKKFGSADGCNSLMDVKQRYKKLDSVFNEIRKEGRFKTREELNPGNFREQGGIFIHIGPTGEPFFGGRGIHRFAIAYILGIPFPAQMGIVHKDGIRFLREYRRMPSFSCEQRKDLQNSKY
jgi:hypothetical protein